MTNHPNRQTKAHHFTVKADPATGEWDESTMEYAGMVDWGQFCEMRDGPGVHYDGADPTAHRIIRDVASEAGVEIGGRTVAVTATW